MKSCISQIQLLSCNHNFSSKTTRKLRQHSIWCLLQRFEWPVARPVESHEVLQIQLLSYNRYFSNKVLGTYGLVLQKVVQDGHLMVADTLLDLNNKPLPVS
jgi:hypothetical protein